MKLFRNSALSAALILSTISGVFLTTVKNPTNVTNNIFQIETSLGGEKAEAVPSRQIYKISDISQQDMGELPLA
jgi:hypothetical protein